MRDVGGEGAVISQRGEHVRGTSSVPAGHHPRSVITRRQCSALFRGQRAVNSRLSPAGLLHLCCSTQRVLAFPPQRSPGGQASTAHRGEGHRGQISRTRPRHPDVPACPPRGSSPLPRVPDRAGVSRCIGGERQPRARLSLVALVVGATATLSLPPNR